MVTIPRLIMIRRQLAVRQSSKKRKGKTVIRTNIPKAAMVSNVKINIASNVKNVITSKVTPNATALQARLKVLGANVAVRQRRFEQVSCK